MNNVGSAGNNSNGRNEPLTALKAFIAADKYVLYEWSPGDCTDEADKKQVNDFINACAGKLLLILEAGNTTTGKSLEILSGYTSEVADLMLDTEDCEFIHELLCELAEIINVKEQYLADDPAGRCFLELFKEAPVNEVLHRQCMECGTGFSVDVQSRLDIVPPLWLIVRCNSCATIDYMELPQGLQQFSAGGFKWVGMLEKTLFDRGDVIERLQLYMHLDGSSFFSYVSQ